MTELHVAGASPLNDHPDPDARKVAAAAQTLTLLTEQADQVRAELVKLRRELAETQRDFSAIPSTHLLEANEQLVLAALRAEAIAETAESNLSELTHSSQRDPLTHTPNRALMLDRLETAVGMACRHGTRIAVLFLDVDHFKQINDMLGHAAGDEVLQLVARRLESVVRHSDTVSRHGGDEFLVLLPEIAHASDAALIADKMRLALAVPSHVGDHAFSLSASIGIAVYPQDGDDVATLIQRADAAMYRAKQQAHGSFEFHRDEQSSEAIAKPVTLDPMPQPITRHESVPRLDERRNQNMREANGQLVIAALIAQEREAHNDAAHRQQIEFLAIVPHELRSPLSAIRTAAELLIRARTDPALFERLQLIIKRQAIHLSRLVDDLVDGSRVTTGKFRLERSRVEMAGILNLAVETCRPAIDTRLQRLTLQVPTRPLYLFADAARLTQIFGNLLDNASKYTPKGGDITLEAKVLDDVVVITVSDNGIGISAEALPNIFDLFVQDRRTLDFHHGGLGIGLAVARELVKAHGGTVEGSSEGSGLGSQFVVTLPLAKTPNDALNV